jgi:glycosyltransferase involved in cell wall biosynthesis
VAHPYVSIGLPVYNGERFLARAVETVLGQTFGDFELVISDNGSTDRTEELCRKYAAEDPRVRYERHETNRGASWNFNRVLEIADPAARYFKHVAADDEHAPEFLARTIAILDDDPSVAVAHTGTADIDDEGYVLHVYDQPVTRLESHDPAERIRDLITLNHECFQAFGLVRHEVVKQSRGLGAFADSDNVMLVEYALRGRFVQDEEVLFFRRQHPDRSMVSFVNTRERHLWFDPDRKGEIVFPAWRVGEELFKSVQLAPLSRADRRRCYLALRDFVRWNWPSLAKNVVRSSMEGAAAVTHSLSRAAGPGDARRGGA